MVWYSDGDPAGRSVDKDDCAVPDLNANQESSRLRPMCRHLAVSGSACASAHPPDHVAPPVHS